ncbi:hypothetical protein PAV_1c05250 [Paenibacillus alvei DSM 29]|nr:hypothetical protein PAV_1c05250 [Paenibacillus alvei DSM 29]
MINCSVEVVKKPIVKRFIPSFLDMINGSFGEFVNRLHLSSLDAAKAKKFRFCNHFTNNMYFSRTLVTPFRKDPSICTTAIWCTQKNRRTDPPVLFTLFPAVPQPYARNVLF